MRRVAAVTNCLPAPKFVFVEPPLIVASPHSTEDSVVMLVVVEGAAVVTRSTVESGPLPVEL